MAFGDSIGGAFAGAALADAHDAARTAERERDFARADLAALRRRHANLLKRFSEERTAMLTEFFAKKKLMYIHAEKHDMTEQEVRALIEKDPDDSAAEKKAQEDWQALSEKERAKDAEYGIKWKD